MAPDPSETRLLGSGQCKFFYLVDYVGNKGFFGLSRFRGSTYDRPRVTFFDSTLNQSDQVDFDGSSSRLSTFQRVFNSIRTDT